MIILNLKVRRGTADVQDDEKLDLAKDQPTDRPLILIQ